MDELLNRGVDRVIPSTKELEKVLKSKKKLNVYLGIDPTAPKIHLGHAILLRKLQQFAELGHDVTFLIGDFTALIGDTSDKDSERPTLTKYDIESNFQTYKSQAEKILDFSKIKVRYNSAWLNKLTAKDIIELFREFSVGDFISRELISKRMKDGKRVRLDEVIYPVMQGFDSYKLEADIQIGGADQIYNMQAGRVLNKNMNKKNSFVISTEYLMGTDGRKMSKSWGNAIWLDDEPYEMYAKVMSIHDDQILPYIKLATNLTKDYIKLLERDLKRGKHPMRVKHLLALQIVTELHTKKAAETAQLEFKRVVQKKETPKNIKEINLNEDIVINEELLIDIGLVTSKSSAKRLFQQKGVSLNGEKIKSGTVPPDEEVLILSVGKKMVKLKSNV